ncbi:unnamed protein product [Rhizoctonia solani]|uniref:Zn(2)-C6 fungal-type domain-containing protein n=1 Tax=Rhizoctonia solani TaxID=456999 RepID=A0A8H2XJJ5_9AGAM|nr:unnamed protein product [Rhizoctonia solani]
MDAWDRFPPGPIGTSCLTCKRRHKKCDRNKPICERCLKGGYVCQGYEHKKPNGTRDLRITNPAMATNTGSSPLGSSSSAPSSLPRTADTDATWNNDIIIVSGVGYQRPVDKCSPQLDNIAATPNTVGQTMPRSLGYKHQQDLSNSLSFDDDHLIYDTFPPTKSTARETETPPPRTFQDENIAVHQQTDFTLDVPLLELTPEIPRGVSITPSDIRHIVEYVISHFDRVRSTAYFKPQDDPIEGTRRLAVWRLSTCAFARGGMLIDAKIRDSIMERRGYGNSSEFASWIEGFEQAVRVQLDQSTTSEELRERLIDSLEILFAKSVILGATATYRLFCQFAPKFLQIINSTPTLRSDQNDHTISIAHLLASPFYKCVNYTFMDIMGSMVYGLPHILEYNTDIDLFHTQLHPVEWVNCLPGEFLLTLAKLNIFRDRGMCDWRAIKQWLVFWEPSLGFEPKGLESWKSIAWVALQETWRHTLLIYLYLAVCGAHTDDPRIQASLRQVFQLIGIIKRQDSPMNNAHIFAPYLIVGWDMFSYRKTKKTGARAASLWDRDPFLVVP